MKYTLYGGLSAIVLVMMIAAASAVDLAHYKRAKATVSTIDRTCDYVETTTDPEETPLPSSGPFTKSRYRFTSGVRAGEVVSIRDEMGQTLFTYRSFASVVGVVGLVVSVIIAVTGAAAVLFLPSGRRIATDTPQRLGQDIEALDHLVGRLQPGVALDVGDAECPHAVHRDAGCLEQRAGQLLVLGDRLRNGAGAVRLGRPDPPLLPHHEVEERDGKSNKLLSAR